MDDLLQTALLGTAKQPAPPAEHPADALMTRLGDQSAEHHLLLRAGARRVHELAGYVAQSAEAIPAAPPDSRPVCSRRAAQILADWLAANQHELLVEAFQRLDRAGQRLPPDLLPQALTRYTGFSIYMAGEDPKLEEQAIQLLHRFERVARAIPPVLGERGQWLSRIYEENAQNSEPAVASGSDLVNPSPDLEEENWKEASHRERRWILERLRQTDPDRARQWLTAVWSEEKAEHRAEFLEKLSVGLSPRDEEFLEHTLEDRSAKVQVIAASLLARLPRSALAQRMCALAETILAYTPPTRKGMSAALRKMVGKEKPGTLEVHLPRQFDKTWGRDGIREKPPAGTSARTFWASQVLALVPPSHWIARFRAPAVELVAAAETSEDGLVALEAWSQAAILFGEQPWIQALWDGWYQHEAPKKRGLDKDKARTWLAQLAENMEGTELERRAIQLLEDPASERKIPLAQLVEALPRPWSPALARKYLTVLREYIARFAENSKSQGPRLHETFSPLQGTFYHAAVALPDACFVEALAGWDVLPNDDNKRSSIGRMIDFILDQFLPVVRLRKEFRDQVASITPTGDHS